VGGVGGVDAVVHNAGFGVFGSVEELDEAASARQFDVTLLGPLALTRRLLPGLRARRGRVVFIGSLAGRLSLPFQAHYSATKAAIAALSDALRMELRPHGVTVTCVEPGDFATGFTAARELYSPDGSPYRGALARCHAAAERTERQAPGPDVVARVVSRLLRRRNPPARRPVGRLARTICLLHRLLPDRLRERLVRSTYGV
jgi:short-subunit dehydrogenase